MQQSGLVAVWVALVMIMAMLVGSSAGILMWLKSKSVPGAFLTGGGAAGGVLAIAIAAGALFWPPG